MNGRRSRIKRDSWEEERSRSRDKKEKERHEGKRLKHENKGEKRIMLSSSSSSSSSSYEQYSFSSASDSQQNGRQVADCSLAEGQAIEKGYRIKCELGTGTFAKVYLADKDNALFAIKVIKPAHLYINAAKKQSSTIKLLNKEDEKEKYHLVKYFQSFYHRQYYCLVFEPLAEPLSTLLKLKVNKGLPVKQIKGIAQHIFEAIGFMHKLGYTHTDLKPENILFCLNKQKEQTSSTNNQLNIFESTSIKLIDFGGATYKFQRHCKIITTRYYRAPQVILQCCDWNQSADIWSIGCILYEMYTGNRKFPGKNDFEQLLMMTENAQANFPQWMSKGCQNDLSSIFMDGAIDESKCRHFLVDWSKIIRAKQERSEENAQINDLIAKCLQMDPKRRITCEAALKHPFFII